MSEAYVGEIRMFAGSFAPADWRFCDGSLLSIAAYQVLYTLIGTTYGGDGQTTFALPDLRSRVPVGSGTSTKGTNYSWAQTGGVETVTLTTNQMPAHSHTLQISGAPGTASIPAAGGALAFVGPSGSGQAVTYATPGGEAQVPLSPTSMGIAGAFQAHDNLQPSLGMNFIIALNGAFPQRD